MKRYKHIGSYGLVLDNDRILLINKVGGPYDGKLDLPGGTIEYKETPEKTLIRELKEEVGIEVIKYSLYDGISTDLEWIYKDELHKIQHIGFIYKIDKYTGNILKNNIITEINDDSKGCNFYDISALNKSMLSNIAFIEIEKLGYKIKE